MLGWGKGLVGAGGVTETSPPPRGMTSESEGPWPKLGKQSAESAPCEKEADV